MLTPRDYRRTVAECAAQRELAALLSCGTDGAAIQPALRAHQCWLQRLLGCPESAVRPYITWRLEMIQRVGAMPASLYLADATECVIHIIRREEVEHAA